MGAKQLTGATLAELNVVMRYCRDGWPKETSSELQKDEISVEANCLFRGTRVIIPTCLHPQVLAE